MSEPVRSTYASRAEAESAILDRALAALTVARRLRMQLGEDLGEASPPSPGTITVPKLDIEDENDPIEVSPLSTPRNGEEPTVDDAEEPP